MGLNEEIQVIRRELQGVERNVAHLSLRLNEIEARQRRLSEASVDPPKTEPVQSAVVRPKKKVPIPPPPLPPTFRRWRHPIRLLRPLLFMKRCRRKQP